MDANLLATVIIGIIGICVTIVVSASGAAWMVAWTIVKISEKLGSRIGALEITVGTLAEKLNSHPTDKEVRKMMMSILGELGLAERRGQNDARKTQTMEIQL